MPNITVHIDDEQLVRKAKSIAALRGKSVSQLVREYLKEEVRRSEELEEARKTVNVHMNHGYSLGGTPLSREEAHER